ncbi:MAG: ATP-binding cassette domain-containing protein [Phycisphaera sp.]|nr:ATP-binding cassette domain-containing protein [Phycisphaera sp.]
MIEFDSVEKRYASSTSASHSETIAVCGVNLSVPRGELLVILGESGSGKTTLLKMVNRLIPITAGSISVVGTPTSQTPRHELCRRIGYVFQGVGLMPHLTISQNIAITPALLGWPRERIRARVDELLQLVSLPPGDYRDRLPRQLSGGQRQRVGVARALAAEPGIVLMDEPFGALDPLTRDQLQREYRAIHDRLGLTTVMVTHDMTEALLLADRIAVMKEGTLLRVGSPHELLTEPGDEYTAALMRTPREQADRVEALIAEGGRA